MRKAVALGTLLVSMTLVVPPASAAETAVGLQGSMYTPKDVVIATGGTVVWTNNDPFSHTVSADDDSFDSHGTCGAGGACLEMGETYEMTFSTPGKVTYYCRIHGAKGGSGMAGTVTVLPVGLPAS